MTKIEVVKKKLKIVMTKIKIAEEKKLKIVIKKLSFSRKVKQRYNKMRLFRENVLKLNKGITKNRIYLEKN